MRLISIALLLLTACASPSRYVQAGFVGAEKGLKGIDVGLDLASNAYASAYAANEVYCRSTLGRAPTREAKDECTKAFRNASEVAAKAQLASELYDTAVEVLAELRKVSVELVREMESVKQ